MFRLRLLLSPLVLVLVIARCLAVSSASAATRAETRAPTRVPQGFVGMNLDGPLLDAGVNLAGQLDTMVSSGIESVRVTFNWAAAQPYASWKDVPLADASEFVNVGGLPTDFTTTDQIVGLAAARGLQVLPTILYAPAWDSAPHSKYTFARPATNAPYASYLTALVHRYGPHSSFWQDHAGRPVRMWQIWNEPDIPTFWPTRPFVPTYVALLRAAHSAIKRADPGAEVVLAGLPNYSWVYLASLYKAGARGLFDVVAAHPYTAQPAGVITILQRIRKVMDRNGDINKPILATEVSWPSSKGKAKQDFGTTEAGQAANLAALLPMLATARVPLGLMGFDYYDWVGDEYSGAPAFNYAGLFRFSNDRLVAKPAFAAFRRAALALDACRVKGSVATSCLKPDLSRHKA